MSRLVWWRGTGEEGEVGHESRGKMRWRRERGVRKNMHRRRENIHCSFSLSASSPSFIALLLSSAPFIQKLYFPSAVSGFCFVSAVSISVLPCPPVSLVLFPASPLSQISLSFLFLSGVGALSAKWKRFSVQALFFQTWCFRQTSGVPEHVLTTPTRRTSHSTFKQHSHVHTLTIDSCFASVVFFFWVLDIQIHFSVTCIIDFLCFVCFCHSWAPTLNGYTQSLSLSSFSVPVLTSNPLLKQMYLVCTIPPLSSHVC